MAFRCGNSLFSFLFFRGGRRRPVAIIRSFQSLSKCIGSSLFRTVLGFVVSPGVCPGGNALRPREVFGRAAIRQVVSGP